MQVFGFVAAMPGAAVLAIMVPVNMRGTYVGGTAYYVLQTRNLLAGAIRSAVIQPVLGDLGAAAHGRPSHGCGRHTLCANCAALGECQV